ncbi:hypothetical protein GP2143_01760 [marine gamma proteobacterium HTCC2143]|uniref:Uncharacterized protein n=1 Tax=marine gamma proteobacterium HTCC2143 TaxID=247633 RepID=A0YFX9_9GAMM|nr:hypothetical protein GP2143_01760 [marine gamma proteobacterium HTCC2143]
MSGCWLSEPRVQFFFSTIKSTHPRINRYLSVQMSILTGVPTRLGLQKSGIMEKVMSRVKQNIFVEKITDFLVFRRAAVSLKSINYACW